MNLIQRELRSALYDYKFDRERLQATNAATKPKLNRTNSLLKADALSDLNRSRARLMNVIKATNVLLNRVAA